MKLLLLLCLLPVDEWQFEVAASEPALFTFTEQEVIESTTPADSVRRPTTIKDRSPTGVRQWYLVSEPWCQHCPAAREVFKAKGWPEQNILTLAQCEARFGFRPDHVPFEFGEPEKAKTDSIYNGKPGSSHESRETLIDHLLNEGIHKGRHTKASLDGMTDQQLDALHTQDHGTLERRPVVQQRGGRWFSFGRRTR